jgi:hypothetical protein
VSVGCETSEQMCTHFDVMILSKKFLVFRTLTNDESFHDSFGCHSETLQNVLFKLFWIETGVIYHAVVLLDFSFSFVIYFHMCDSLHKTKN